MSEKTKIRHLITLMDAESENVRQLVEQELMASISDLEALLEESPTEFRPETLYRLYDLIQRVQGERFREGWLSWLGQDGELRQLESALAYLARIDSDQRQEPPLHKLLDRLVEEFHAVGYPQDVLALNRFLFVEQRLKGAVDDYYHPDHSNLVQVIRYGKGQPISLACVFMLCGARLAIEIQGFNLPGHFLARAEVGGKTLLFDCFNGGKVLTRGEISALKTQPKVDIPQLFAHPPSARELVARVLVNLVNAYYRCGRIELYHLCGRLLADLRGENKHLPVVRPKDRSEPMFKLGQLVRHKRYDYRGVIVDLDRECKADSVWYYRNQTQPRRDQPWYHILVNGSDVSTYAAESSLVPDVSGQEIEHPLIHVYFCKFTNGHYVRNEVPWNF